MIARYKESILFILLISIVFVVTATKTFPKFVEFLRIENGINLSAKKVKSLNTQLSTLQKQEAEKTTLTHAPKKIFKPDIASEEVETTFSVMFDDIIDMAKYNGIKIYAVEYNYNPADDPFIKGSESASTKYNVCVVDMQIVSDYTSLMGFLREIYKYPYMINMDKIQLAPYAKNKKIILTTLSLKLYSQS